MVRGLFSAGSAMLVFSGRQDLLANDLANAATPGYRTEVAPVAAFPEMLIHRELRTVRTPRGLAGTGAYIERSYTRWDPAPARYTGRNLDLAIEGDGFFVVQSAAGPRLTRAGNFTIGSDGVLVTQDGLPVLGLDGPVRTGRVTDGEIAVTQEGAVMTEDGRFLGQILVVDVPDRQGLVREGSNLFRYTAESGGPVRVDARVQQGMLEGSGTSVIGTMVEMIAGMRAYQAAQQAVRAHDQMTEALIAQLGRTS
ncbi:MAG: flagellar hook-basal body protein [Bacillota bacterium]